MDWSQILLSFIGNLPATIAALTGLVVAVAALFKINAQAKKTEEVREAVTDNTKKTVEAASAAKEATDKISKAVNGDLDARFRRIEDAVASVERAIASISGALHDKAILLAVPVTKEIAESPPEGK